MTPLNAVHHQTVTQIPARPFDKLFWTRSITIVRRFLSSGSMGLLELARQRFFKQSQSFFVVHREPMRFWGAAFSFQEERVVGIKAIFCSQHLHINSQSKYLNYVNT